MPEYKEQKSEVGISKRNLSAALIGSTFNLLPVAFDLMFHAKCPGPLALCIKPSTPYLIYSNFIVSHTAQLTR